MGWVKGIGGMRTDRYELKTLKGEHERSVVCRGHPKENREARES